MKALLAAILISALLVSIVAGMPVFETVKANFVPAVSIEVRSPVNGGTYKSTPILDVAVNFYAWGSRSKFVAYSLDGLANNTLTGYFIDNDELSWFNGKTTLPKLSEGEHYIKVYAWVAVENDSVWADYSWASSKIVFYINQQETSNGTPRVEILSPENTTYYDTEVSLKVAVNTSASWIGYSLDNHANITLADNSSFLVGVEISLTGLADGSHSLVTYANDSAGNMGKSDTVFFNIEPQSSQSPSPTPTLSPSPSVPEFPTLMILSMFIMAMATLVLVVHFKKCKP